MDYKERIESAVGYVVDDNYDIYNRAVRIRARVQDARNVCIFGLGQFFEDCANHIDRYDCVSDNDPGKWGKQFNGRLCVPPSELTGLEDLVVVIMIGEYRPIAEALEKLGVENYSCDHLFLNVYDPHYPSAWFIDNLPRMLQALDLFADERSMEVYTEALLNRIAPQLSTKIFNELKTPGEYFAHGVFELSAREFMVDAGAYNGDSLEKFICQVSGRFGKVYSFELDHDNFEKLKEKARGLSNSNIELFNAGVFNENKDVSSGGERFGSFVDCASQGTARVVRLDDALAGRKVTFIKMDVEGSELRALEGAKNIITEQGPKLAISAYHFLSDLWEIPLYIRELDSRYRIYMRHHSPVVWDTDCYAFHG